MSWRPWYALLLLFATIVSFACGLLIAAAASQNLRRAYLIAGCTANLAVLFIFKYFDFLNTQTRDLMALIGVDPQASGMAEQGARTQAGPAVARAAGQCFASTTSSSTNRGSANAAW